jgi:hypothetical protein
LFDANGKSPLNSTGDDLFRIFIPYVLFSTISLVPSILLSFAILSHSNFQKEQKISTINHFQNFLSPILEVFVKAT